MSVRIGEEAIEVEVKEKKAGVKEEEKETEEREKRNFGGRKIQVCPAANQEGQMETLVPKGFSRSEYV